jgi:signal transduction histidine kinase
MQTAPAIRIPSAAASGAPRPGRVTMQSPVIAYPGAILFTALALLARIGMDPWVGTSSRLVIFMIATALSAFMFGKWPGILSTLLGVALADYFFFPPIHSFHFKTSDHVIAMVSATVQGLLISYCAGYFHRALRLRADAEAQLRGLYESERQALSASEDSNRMKDYFLAVLSHELRGPVSAIQYCVGDRLEDRSLAADLHADFELIDRNARMQARLISDLLDVTRLSRGKMAIESRPLDIHELISEVARSSHPTHLMQSGPMPALLLRAENPWISGDRDRLFQVLWNILRNAEKFTPPEGHIEVETFQPAPDRVAIRIRDSGVGLTSEALDRIFRPFEQAGSVGDKKEGGLGLGLAIARGLAELHGGTLTGSSDGPGRGATFTLELPTTVPPAKAADYSPSVKALASGAPVEQ